MPEGSKPRRRAVADSDASLADRLEYPRGVLDRCANCDQPLTIDNRALFCSEACAQMASYVRYARRVARDPARVDDAEVAEALRIKLAFVLGGGYPAAERELTNEERAAVIARDGGRCQDCGGPAGQIDHIAGSSNDMSNLQLLCDTCHRRKTTAALLPAGPEEMALAMMLQSERVDPDQPSRPCDDEVDWADESRRRRSARIAMLWDQLLGETGTERSDWTGWTWSDLVEEWLDCAGYMDGPGDMESFIGEW